MSVSCRLNVTILFLALLACGSFAARAQSCPAGSPQVNTPLGAICGTLGQSGQKQVSVYRGIPYAQPPVGQNRWKAPQALSALPKNPFPATQLACICPQTAQGDPTPTVLPACSANPAQSKPFTQSEDCLYLNVWTPANATAASNLPVMVFMHGGGYINGSGEGAAYDGSSMVATGNVIVVTFNYRLGALGYLPMNHDSNFGLQDQYQALIWVQNNIASFGGNPKNVTFFGESAGAMSVGLMTLSLSQPSPYQAAIMESNPLGIPYKQMKDALKLKTSFALAAGCLDLLNPDPCLMNLTPDRLLTAENVVAMGLGLVTKQMSNLLAWSPVIDGTLLSGIQPIAAAQSGRFTLPMILGTNKDEGNVFVGGALQQIGIKSISPTVYGSFLNRMFGPTIATAIQQNPAYGCAPPATDCTQQMETAVTDYAFTCPNRLLAQQSKNPNTYVYQFTQNDYNLWPSVPQCVNHVCHGDEIPFVFNNPVVGPFSNGDKALSAVMEPYWTNFGTSHNPNGNSLFTWPAYGSAQTYIFLNSTLATANDPLNATANCDFWNGIQYENSALWSNLLAALKTPNVSAKKTVKKSTH